MESVLESNWEVLEPDLYSYNELLKGFCKANMVDRAHLMMVERMQTKGMCDVVMHIAPWQM